jgi:hypothetical protein
MNMHRRRLARIEATPWAILIDSRLPRAMEGALANRVRKRVIQTFAHGPPGCLQQWQAFAE